MNKFYSIFTILLLIVAITIAITLPANDKTRSAGDNAEFFNLPNGKEVRIVSDLSLHSSISDTFEK